MFVKLFVNKLVQLRLKFLMIVLFIGTFTAGLVSQKTSMSEDQGTVLYVNTKSGLILRKEADKKSQKLDLMPYGQKVISEQSVLMPGSSDESSGWISVKYNGKEGYASAEFLSFIDPKKAKSSHWKCTVLYNYNPGKETYNGELILFKDSTYITIASYDGKSIGDQGTYVQTGNRISFKSRMDQTPEELIIMKKYLIESKYKSLIDKDPNLISKLEKSMQSAASETEPDEKSKIVMNVCSPNK